MPADPAGRVLVVGDVATDVLAVTGSADSGPHSGPWPGAAGGLALGSDTRARIRLTAGGSAANTAAWLATTGTPVTLIAAVGDDDAGRARLAELTGTGVHCAVDRRAGVDTGAVVVLSDPTERTMLCDRGANRHLTGGHVTASVAAATDAVHLHLSAYPLFDPESRPAARGALAAARAAGLSTSVDAASAGPLRQVGTAAFTRWVGGVDLLLANLDEARVLTADPTTTPMAAASRLRGLAAHVVVKAGAEGAVWADRHGTCSVPAVPVTAVDPTGAGDAFAAGLLAAHLSGATPTRALAAGAALGAHAVGHPGARPTSGGTPR